MVARVRWAFQVSQGSVETSFRLGGKRLHLLTANLFRKRCTKFRQHRPSFIGDNTQTFWSLFRIQRRTLFCVIILNRLQHIQNSLARGVVRATKSTHINPALKSLHWLKINQRIDYNILSLTYKVLTTSQPSYLHVYNLISVQPHRSTRSSDIITLSLSLSLSPPSSSSLKVNNRSFRHASPCLWNQLPNKLRLPTDHKDLSLSSDLTHVSSSFPASPLSPSITPSHFHSKLKTHLFHKSFPS